MGLTTNFRIFGSLEPVNLTVNFWTEVRKVAPTPILLQSWNSLALWRSSFTVNGGTRLDLGAVATVHSEASKSRKLEKQSMDRFDPTTED
jgi:hypothetical protein